LAEEIIKFKYADTDLVFDGKADFVDWCDYHANLFSGITYRNNREMDPSNFFGNLKRSDDPKESKILHRPELLPPIRQEEAGRFLIRLSEVDNSLFKDAMAIWAEYGRRPLSSGTARDGKDAHLISIIAVARAGAIPVEAEFLKELIEEQRQAQVKLYDTRKQFTEFMNVAAAVEYWSEKRVEHERGESAYLKRTKWFGALFCFAAIAVPYLFIDYGFSWLSSRAGIGDFHEVAVFYLLIGLYVFLLSTGLWCLRILVKLYLSEHHLKSDAFERFTMVKTYLALHREDAVAAEDRTVVLSALFRTSHDGVVKEEGIDPSIPHLLAKALSR
jgi:hypothetical protein